MNSYQRLKKEKQELLNDIYVLVKNNDFKKICEVRNKWLFKILQSEVVWHGNPTAVQREFLGLTDHLLPSAPKH